MATMIAAPSESRGSMLDSPPPGGGGRSIASIAGGPQAMTGPEAGSPQIMALQGLQFVERGAQMLASTLPEMAPQLAQLVSGLRQAVPQAIAGAGAPAAGGPGMAPMMPPPGM